MKIILDTWKEAEGCFATDRILVDGEKVGYMYREEPADGNDWDSGWRFTAGDESQEYMDLSLIHILTGCSWASTKPGSTRFPAKSTLV